MSKVVIELNLRRRSGVLAGAVAALRPLALQFRSQKLADLDGQPQLTLTTEGELTDLDGLLDAFNHVRGVSNVSDVRVDGQSLLHAPVAPAEPAEQSPVATASDRDAEVDGFNEREFARHVLAGEPEDVESEGAPGASEPHQEPAQRPRSSERPDPSGAPTSAMVRRRRRRR